MQHTTRNTRFLAEAKSTWNSALYSKVLGAYNNGGKREALAVLAPHSRKASEELETLLAEDDRRRADLDMFGCGEDLLKRQLAEGDATDLIISHTSDAQELIAMGRPEQARRILNRVKWFAMEAA